MLGNVLRALNALSHLILLTNPASRQYSFPHFTDEKKSEPEKGLVACLGNFKWQSQDLKPGKLNPESKSFTTEPHYQHGLSSLECPLKPCNP